MNILSVVASSHDYSFSGCWLTWTSLPWLLIHNHMNIPSVVVDSQSHNIPSMVVDSQMNIPSVVADSQSHEQLFSGCWFTWTFCQWLLIHNHMNIHSVSGCWFTIAWTFCQWLLIHNHMNIPSEAVNSQLHEHTFSGCWFTWTSLHKTSLQFPFKLKKNPAYWPSGSYA